jgi:hypothetical protein
MSDATITKQESQDEIISGNDGSLWSSHAFMTRINNRKQAAYVKAKH